MADIVTFSCEYLVVNSGYTSRLLENEMLQQLSDFCAHHGVIPLYIRDSTWDEGRYHSFAVQNGIIVPGVRAATADLIASEITLLVLARNRLNDDGIIVFRAGNFQNTVNVFTNIQQLDYCNWGSLTDMKFLGNGDGQIYLVYTEFNNDDNE